MHLIYSQYSYGRVMIKVTQRIGGAIWLLERSI